MAPEPDPVVLIRQLDRACRVGFLVVAGLFAYIAIRLACNIDRFASVFKDMLSDNALPPLTMLVISAKPALILLSFGLPALAIVIALRVRRSDHAVIGIALCCLALYLLSSLMWSGLMEPFFSVISALSSDT
jgi:hypothetical protein